MLDLLHWTLSVKDEAISEKLTPSEMIIMRLLAQAPGEIVHRKEIITGLGYEYETYDQRRLEVIIRRFRMKFEDKQMELPIKTARGKGYIFTGKIDIHNENIE